MERETKELKLVWPKDTGMALYVNNVTIQTDESLNSYLTFFQTVPPIVFGEPADIKEQLRNIDTVEAKPVAKLVLTRDMLKKLAELINGQLTITHDSSSSSAKS